MTPTDTPIFDLTAGPHAPYIEGLLRTPVPTKDDIIAAVDAAAEGDAEEGSP